MKRSFSRMALAFVTAASLWTPAPADPGAELYVENEVLVRFRKPAVPAYAAAAALTPLRRRSGAQARAEERPIYKMRLRNRTVAQALAELRANPDVEIAEPNYLCTPMATTPNDNRFPEQWGLHNTGQTSVGIPLPGTVDADVDAPEAWDTTKGSRSIVVAFIDSGIDWDHPDLAGNMWTNNAERVGAAGVDDDLNGYIDDVYGYDFVDHEPNPMDADGHGTHVAGIVGAVTNNSDGVAGVMWNVKLMSCRFLSNNSGSTSGAIEAINYAIDNGATVINNSWGMPTFSQLLQQTVERAEAQRIVVVAAAGNTNSSTVFYPAGYPTVLAVASSANTDQLNPNSNFGSHVDLAAPGLQILSTKLSGVVPEYEYKDGTSMASPFVSGGAGLLLTIAPSLSPAQVRQALVGSVDVPAGWDTSKYGAGRLNIRNALNNLPDNVPPQIQITSHTSGQTVSGSITVLAAATDNRAVKHVEFLVDGTSRLIDTTSPYQLPIDTTALTNGNHSITARAYDTSDNANFISVSLRVSNDAAGPVVSITSPAPGAEVSGDVTIVATAIDDVGVSRAELWIDGAKLSDVTIAVPLQIAWDTTAVSNGSHTVTIKAWDASDNLGEDTHTVTVANAGPGDNTPPLVTITSPSEGDTVVGQITVAATATDDVAVQSVELVVNGDVVATDNTAPYEFPLNTLLVPNGPTDLVVRATDPSGNIGQDTVSVVIANTDSVPPTVQITVPQDGAEISGALDLTATAADNQAVIQVSFFLDGALLGSDESAPYQVPWDSTAASNGTHTLQAEATDAAGNAASHHITITTRNEQDAPEIAITSPQNGATLFGRVSISANATDDIAVTSVRFFVDDDLVGDDAAAPWTASWTSTPGTHVIRAEARDAAGHMSQASITVTGSDRPSQNEIADVRNSFFPARNEEAVVAITLSEPSHVKAVVYNTRGVEIRTIADNDVATAASEIRWNGRNDANEVVAAGLYLTVVTINGSSLVKKFILRK